MVNEPLFIFPDWPAPAQVRAVSTTRLGGVSLSPYDSLNLGAHVGDNPAAVAANRQRLRRLRGLPTEPAWLNQVHGNTVVAVERHADLAVEADAVYTGEPGRVCIVMTADCLPVLLCDRAGAGVAAVHAGWRGLRAGVIEAALARMGCPPEQLLAWLGPAIGPKRFEVGEAVRQAFLSLDRENAACFKPLTGRWLADIYALARRQLHALGVSAVYGGDWCTFTDSQRFFSYRRDGCTGRMASLIWLTG